MIALGMTQYSYSQSVIEFARRLDSTYESYKRSEITTRKFKHADMMNILTSLRDGIPETFSMEQKGVSAEGRSINLLSLGTGEKKILLWSQMHGDESTATMALLDALSYIGMNPRSDEVQTILSGTRILIIPMLNPDGAERFTRRNAQGIDINRDAKRQQSPEGRLLKKIRDDYSPEYGFNLHDQDPRTTSSPAGTQVTISLLAPAFDASQKDNEVRFRAKLVAAELVDIFSRYINGHIGLYDDTYEPRAFGDNIQSWGTSTILIESGGWPDDPEKMYIRKLNCIALLAVLYSIATDHYKNADVSRYELLPRNGKSLYDIVLEGVMLKYENGLPQTMVDIGINIPNRNGDLNGMRRGRIVDIGDLSTQPAQQRMKGRGAALPGEKIVMENIIDVDELIKIIQSVRE
jgi:hypothetical protein